MYVIAKKEVAQDRYLNFSMDADIIVDEQC